MATGQVATSPADVRAQSVNKPTAAAPARAAEPDLVAHWRAALSGVADEIDRACDAEDGDAIRRMAADLRGFAAARSVVHPDAAKFQHVPEAADEPQDPAGGGGRGPAGPRRRLPVPDAQPLLGAGRAAIRIG